MAKDSVSTVSTVSTVSSSPDAGRPGTRRRSGPVAVAPEPTTSLRSTQVPPVAVHFLEDDDQAEALLARLAQEAPARQQVLIQHPDELSTLHLTHRTVLEPHQPPRLTPGLLVDGSPLTLVLDLRALTAQEIARFNDLLDPDRPCIFAPDQGEPRPVSAAVQRLVLVSRQQLPTDAGDPWNSPGADFWRRLSQSDSLTLRDTASVSDHEGTAAPPLPLPSCDPGEHEQNPNTHLIALHLQQDWQHHLFGGPSFDDHGQLGHRPGVLATVKPGDTVILQGLDLEDLTARHRLRNLLSHRCFESNAQVHSLHNVRFLQAPLDGGLCGELNRIADQINWQSCADDQPVLVINSGNLDAWLAPWKVDSRGHLAANRCLQEKCAAGYGLLVSSPLSEKQWIRLLACLAATSRDRPAVAVLSGTGQPEPVRHRATVAACPSTPAAVKLYSFHTITERDHALDQLPESRQLIQITPATRLNQLLDNLHVLSEQQGTLGRIRTPLQQALEQGQPVALLGLESNPLLQHQLEPLLSATPGLLVTGLWHAFPHANLRVFWPDDKASASHLWQAQRAASEPCAAVDIWEQACQRHGLIPCQLPREALHNIYQAAAQACDQPLPRLSGRLLELVIRRARQAQQRDHASQLQPVHWRQAIDSLLSHSTRSQPAVRDFLKQVCSWQLPDPDQHSLWVDQERLEALINNAMPLSPRFLARHRWALVRCFSPAAIQGSTLLPNGKDIELDAQLSALVCAFAPPHWQQQLHDHLNPQQDWTSGTDPTRWQPRSTRRIKRLQDALASGWQLRSLAGYDSRTAVLRELARYSQQQAQLPDQSQARCELEKVVQQCLMRQDELQPGASLATLVEDLLSGRLDGADLQQRRLHRLQERLALSSMLLIEGETGTGKSTMARTLAQQLGPCQVVSLGPETGENALLQAWSWEKRGQDRTMVRQQKAIMRWAQTRPAASDQYVTLVLDEANLAAPGVLDMFNGMHWQPPCLFCDGQAIGLSPHHRVILTGNPIGYGGRSWDSDVLDGVQRLYLPPRDNVFLTEQVIVPALTQVLTPLCASADIDPLVQESLPAVMKLWSLYQELLPERVFTPRDLTDMAAWLGWWLDNAAPLTSPLTLADFHGLIWRAFDQALGQEISPQRHHRREAMRLWFARQFPMNTGHVDAVSRQQTEPALAAFDLLAARDQPDFNTSAPAVRNLFVALYQDVARSALAFARHRAHGGRQATLVQGPAGRGKDATLTLVLKMFRQYHGAALPQPVVVDAGASWDKICASIQEARTQGRILVMPELNLTATGHLEGELNAVLTGEAAPGFHLFATVNPAGQGGRSRLSPALQGRFRQLVLRDYNSDELRGIAATALAAGGSHRHQADHQADKHIDKIVRWHCRLCHQLKQQGLAMAPSARDIRKLAASLAQTPGQDPVRAFESHYHFYLTLATGNCAQLDALPDTAASAQEQPDEEACRWVNLKLADLHPWQVLRGSGTKLKPDEGCILLDRALDDDQARVAMTGLLARHRWQDAGLPADPHSDWSDLEKLCYRLWQRVWCGRFCPQEQAAALDTAFALDAGMQLFLSNPCNQELVQRIEQSLVLNAPGTPVQRPAFWRQLRDALATNAEQWFWPGGTVPSLPVPDSDHALEYMDTGQQAAAGAPGRAVEIWKNDWRLDRRTGPRTSPLQPACRVFQDDVPPGRDRVAVLDMAVEPSGDVLLTEARPGLGGFNIVTTAPLPLPCAEPRPGQHYAVFTPSRRDWCALPSRFPHEDMEALATRPAVPWQLGKDKYTGLHYIRFPSCQHKPGTIEVHYLVRPQPRQEDNTATAVASFPPDPWLSLHVQTLRLWCAQGQLPLATTQKLMALFASPSRQQQLQAILDWCKEFVSENPLPHNLPLLPALIASQQGSCRHRVVACVALCRYCGIAARPVVNTVHMMLEYSLDGRSWHTVDLGGAPAPRAPGEHPASARQAPGDRQLPGNTHPGNTHMVRLEKRLGAGMLSKVVSMLDMPQPQLAKEVQQYAVPECFIVYRLLCLTEGPAAEQGFETALQILADMSVHDREAFFHDEARLGTGSARLETSIVISAMGARGKKPIPSLSERLNRLHKLLVADNGRTCDQDAWCRTMVSACSHLYESAYAALLAFVADRGWLQLGICKPPGFLQRASEDMCFLKSVELVSQDSSFALRTQVRDWWKQWVTGYLGQDLRHAPAMEHVLREGPRFGLDQVQLPGNKGKSVALERRLAIAAPDRLWSDQPEGVPDPERWLQGLPAFAQAKATPRACRPLVILGGPGYMESGIYAVLRKLRDSRVSRGEQASMSSLSSNLSKLIMAAFARYVFQLTHQQEGGRLLFAWIGGNYPQVGPGYMEPRSEDEAIRLLTGHISHNEFPTFGIQEPLLIKRGGSHLRQHYRADNALIIKGNQMTDIFREFTLSLDDRWLDAQERKMPGRPVRKKTE